MIRVGVTSRHHGTGPSFRLAKIPNIEYVDEYLYPMGTRFIKYIPKLQRLSLSIGLARVTKNPNLLHSYQKVLLNRRIPWVVSHDALMPFYPRPYISKHIYDAIFSVLAREECRAVLPHSENALRQMLIRNQDNPYLNTVLDRTKVIYPSVPDYPELAEQCINHNISKQVNLLFVGTQFFIKGGHLVVNAFSKIKHKYPLNLTVVSTLSTADWTTYRPPILSAEWKKKLEDHGVIYYYKLNNYQVRQLMAQADILLLPSIDETFGFVLLEALATGLTTITTNIRAIPEIVEDGKTGILIACDLDEEGRLIRDGKHEQYIEEQITQKLEFFLNNLTVLKAMKQSGRERYLSKFSMTRLAKDLQNIYENI